MHTRLTLIQNPAPPTDERIAHGGFLHDCTWLWGAIHGTVRSFSPDGCLRLLAEVRLGKLHGSARVLGRNGEVEATYELENGVILAQTTADRVLHGVPAFAVPHALAVLIDMLEAAAHDGARCPSAA